MSDNFIFVTMSRQDAEYMDKKYAQRLDDIVEQRLLDGIRKELEED